MSRLLLYVSFLILLCLLSCKGGDDDPISPTDPEINIPSLTPKGNEAYLTGNSDYLFDQESLHTYELILSDAALAQIDANPAAEQYVEGMLIFEGDTLSPVGIRYKGSIGAFVGCVSGPDWANPSGRKTCTKLSMKVKINWEGRKEKFYGVRKLQFHAQNLDDSQLRERLGYWLFRSMGVPGPRSVHARLVINGTYSGLYALTEQIDGRFAKSNFEDGDGNVYKEVWPLTAGGSAQGAEAYLAALKTNEDDPSVAIIDEFGQRLADSDPTTVQAVIEDYMDIPEIISYAVVDRMIRHDDGPFHWYCGGGCSNHNYYWYEEPANRELHLIPWDLDNAFENIIFNRNPVTPIADEWGETTDNCQVFAYGAFHFTQRSAACDKLIAGWASYTDLYEQKKIEFRDGPFSEAQVNALLDAWTAQMRPAIEEADLAHQDATSVGAWEGAVNQLKSQLTFAREN